MSPRIHYSLDEKDIAKAISYWLENGTPKPKKALSVNFTYDRPTNPTPTDYGTGVNATVSE